MSNNMLQVPEKNNQSSLSQPMNHTGNPYAPTMGVAVNSPQQENQQNITYILNKYQVLPSMAERLYLLQNTKIVILADDSSSMLEKTEYGTRWSELQKYVEICIEIVNCANSQGVDLYFLNRPSVIRNITGMEMLNYNRPFEQPPFGVTPLTTALQRVIKEHAQYHQKLLILLATDGEPTEQTWGRVTRETIADFKNALIRKPKNVFVNILACTTDDNTMGYLNKWDEDIDNIDVTDDYESEKAEILNANGGRFEFTYGTYVMKTVLGALDPELDNLDEFGGNGSNSLVMNNNSNQQNRNIQYYNSKRPDTGCSCCIVA